MSALVGLEPPVLLAFIELVKDKQPDLLEAILRRINGAR
jgi:hypothetical protein